MSLKATDITVGDRALHRPLCKLSKEDSRVLLKSQESNESLPLDSKTAIPSAHVPPVCATRTCPTHASEKPHNRTKSGERALVDFLAHSLTEVVAPPFIPTEREHNFFMSNADNQCSGDSSTQMMVRLGLDNAQTSTDPFDAVIVHRIIETEDVGISVAGTQDTTGVSSAAPSITPDSRGTPLHQEQLAPDAKTPEHGYRQNKRRLSLVATAPPFDAMRKQQWNLINRGRDQTLPLYKFEEIPPWQKYNSYIGSRYRAFYTAQMCFKSLFGWHNETINVYSHVLTFLAFLVFTALLYTTVLSKAITMPSLSASKLVYGIFCFGSLMCMLNSSIYHLFNGHCSYRVITAMGRLDYIGITVLIVSSFLPPLYVMFHCNPVARTVYITAILVLGTVGIIGPWTDAFYEHMWVRVSVFLGLGFSGLAPALHSLTIMPMNAVSTPMFLGMLLMVLLYCSGVAFYVTKFPESRYPGHFDCWLSSHQLWHFFVSMGALVHYFNCVSMYQLWQVSDGMCG
ncbi:conserved hypothetical protein [Leishmania braziliensis MHOM/BR/75/M2904]|uniref:Adiponectin receptor protein 1 n=1 Tax=Leishmania braziliensis TaxID=5660 RepID=A4HQ64_LEIBR|nr:conserved hypothetical protein [Leishmania braziliensis MHOM/BR/75/M2904]CAJ2482094.1 unnamed protein product [Leishmania braziliensis]CAM44328.2 conserved hypothetical protein [Leishmania braziliensis MHOM/BR/75/M2904]